MGGRGQCLDWSAFFCFFVVVASTLSLRDNSNFDPWLLSCFGCIFSCPCLSALKVRCLFHFFILKSVGM